MQPPDQRQYNRRNGNLPQLHAQIEGKQRYKDTCLDGRNTHFPQHTSKAEAVNKAEEEGQHTALRGGYLIFPDDIFQADINDGSGNQRLDYAAGNIDDIHASQR